MLALYVTLLACTLSIALGTPTPALVPRQDSQATIRNGTPSSPPTPANAAPLELSLRAIDTTSVITEFSTTTTTVPSSTTTHLVITTPPPSFITTVVASTTVIATTVEVPPSSTTTSLLAANDSPSNGAVGAATRRSNAGHRLCWILGFILLVLNS